MKKILMLILSIVLFWGCSSNSTETVESPLYGEYYYINGETIEIYKFSSGDIHYIDKDDNGTVLIEKKGYWSTTIDNKINFDYDELRDPGSVNPEWRKEVYELVIFDSKNISDDSFEIFDGGEWKLFEKEKELKGYFHQNIEENGQMLEHIYYFDGKYVTHTSTTVEEIQFEEFGTWNLTNGNLLVINYTRERNFGVLDWSEINREKIFIVSKFGTENNIDYFEVETNGTKIKFTEFNNLED